MECWFVYHCVWVFLGPQLQICTYQFHASCFINLNDNLKGLLQELRGDGGIIMKKLFVLLTVSMMAMTAIAQKEVTVKAGTIVPLQVVNATKAADLKKGQKFAFRVSRDINVEGVTAIPYGTVVNGIVEKAKKNSWWGIPGKLEITTNEIVMPNGEVIPIENGHVKVKGKNRIALSVCLFAVAAWPCCFIHGKKAELPAGYEIQATIAQNTQVKVY